ncbi:NBR1-Ig-like domain-containing protein [Mycobacterium sp. Aquia_213]|uniref:NBR1-Ig-like domain-containing protein n=1 Tax=Mycobacterium sp. Aquia_213 TaxID=2991728 RepID=UPI00226F623D|nr:NBR1-Ig-like domain-containing protein [Mycobacterium sp. Aquia_213]WAC90218.1 NBR1-Ig-like domain-containing protein [Mycobacterium sp. Aquia_213]
MRSDGAQLALGQQLRYLRKAGGMSQAEAARRIGVSATHLNNVEKGRDPANGKIVAFYEEQFRGDGQAWGLYNAMLTESRPPQRLPMDKRPNYPIPGDASTFVADITIPDGMLMPPYHEFEKTWRIRNSGTVAWIGRWLARRGSPTGHGVPTSLSRVRIPDTQPGEEVDITVPVRSQPLAGASQVHWKMVDDQGWEYFPDRYALGLVLSIVVSGGHSEE